MLSAIPSSVIHDGRSPCLLLASTLARVLSFRFLSTSPCRDRYHLWGWLWSFSDTRPSDLLKHFLSHPPSTYSSQPRLWWICGWPYQRLPAPHMWTVL